MKLFMSGLEHNLAPIQLREQLSFTKTQTGKILQKIKAMPGICGCVLISTCNRTELYVTSHQEQNPGALLCSAAGAPYEPYREAFRNRREQEVVQHLAQVASGLRSRIWGEDQILTQVKNAIASSREEACADPILETLFRTAVAAGKQIKTDVRLNSVPTSAASMAVELLRSKTDLQGKSVIVIGNGEMGRLAASLLERAGCHVSVTLRTYHHGETIIPSGCGVVPYDDRFLHMDTTDILVSATTSPHYTVTLEQYKALNTGPKLLVDLAIPRDIAPEIGNLPGVSLYNIDDLGDCGQMRTIPEEAQQILQEHMDNFYRWLHYRECSPSRESLKQAILERLLLTAGAEADEAMLQSSIDKTVDLLVGGLAQHITPESLSLCESKIRTHTTGKPQQPENLQSYRFPLFVDLNSRKVVIIGGGRIALRRARMLVAFGAQVTMIAPEFAAVPEGVTTIQRPYAPGDLKGAYLAAAATNNRQVNRQVGLDADALGIPVSVCDSKEESTFYFPAICQGGGLIAGVVSDGTQHCKTARAAEAIRQILEEDL